ncbi:MAG TPA: hypothetical protein VN911_15210 [Candidatus Acidoferrum sp.]|nr:hypothetical protein [Candidatus Acidoferrum sp.]
MNNNSAYDSPQKLIPIVAAGSHHLTNFDADSAHHAASPRSDSFTPNKPRSMLDERTG